MSEISEETFDSLMNDCSVFYSKLEQQKFLFSAARYHNLIDSATYRYLFQLYSDGKLDELESKTKDLCSK